MAYLNYEFDEEPRDFWGAGSHIWHIETALPGGTGRHRLARLPGSDSLTAASSPSWSPDGRFIGIAMYGNDGDEGEKVAGIHVVSLDGTVTWLGALRPTFPDWGIDWSPDGKHLAIVVSGDGATLGRWNADEVSLEWDAPGPLEERLSVSHLAWAPTSDHIYYAASGPTEATRTRVPERGGWRTEPPAGAGAELMVMDVNTKEKRPVARIRPERPIHTVQVSPDRQRVLLTSARNAGYLPVQAMDIDGSEPMDVCCPWLRNSAKGSLWASWSPNGERVALLNVDRNHEVALRTMRPDGSDEKVLIRWNEDGTLAPGQPQ